MSQYYQSNVSKLLHESLLKLCSENIPYDTHLEIDGIICISTGDDQKQIIVKVHEIIENVEPVVWPEEPVNLSKQIGQYTTTRDTDEPQNLTKNYEYTNGSPGVPNKNSPLGGRGYHSQKLGDILVIPKWEVNGNYLPKEDKFTTVEIEDTERKRNQNSAPLVQAPTDTEDELTDFEYDLSSSNPECPKTILPSQEIVPLSKRRVSRHRVPAVEQLGAGHAFGEVTCRFCSQKFMGYLSLINHNLDVHKRYSCRQCLNTFSLQCNLRRHERLHTGAKPFPCHLCNRSFSRGGDLKIHELKHRVDSDLCNTQCRRCNQLFVSRTAYRDHICKVKGHTKARRLSQLDHIFSNRLEKMENGEEFSKDYEIEENMEINLVKTEPKDEIVKECLTNSSSTLEPVGHQSVRSNGDPWMSKPQSPSQSDPGSSVENKYANFSSMDFLSFVALQIDAHENSLKQMKEETTQIKSAENSYLTSPLISEKSDFKSPLYSPTESNSSLLPIPGGKIKTELPKPNNNKHGLEPSEEKVYLCKMCKTRWNGYRAYDEHYQKRHLRYPCHLCDQTFTNKNNRSRHIRNHMGQRVYNCSECGKSFSRSDTLKEHQIIHTEGYIGDKCHYCGLNIKKKAELLAHIKKCARINKAF